MSLEITKEFLKEHGACSEGLKWVIENGLIDLEAMPFLEKLITADKLEWANWLIVRVMTKPQYLSYAIYADEQVIDLFEKKFPDDKRPRQAIEAARAVLANDNEETRDAAWAAGEAAWAAGEAAWAAGEAAWAARAAVAAAGAARAAAWAARAAAWAAVDAAWAAGEAGEAVDAAWAAGEAAYEDMQLKILTFGLELLKGGN